jgi:hypothetical protein
MDTDYPITQEIPIVLVQVIELVNQDISTFWLAVDADDLMELLHVSEKTWKIYSIQTPIAVVNGRVYLLLYNRSDWSGKIEWYMPRKYRVTLARYILQNNEAFSNVDFLSPKFYVDMEGKVKAPEPYKPTLIERFYYDGKKE